MKIERLFADGVLVDLDISTWNGHATLQPEDLGLVPEQIPDIFRLGRKRLISADALRPINQVVREARETLRAWSFNFPIAGARFVPKGSLDVVIKKFDGFEREFTKAVHVFLYDDYEGHKQEMLLKYERYRDALEAYYPSREALETRFGFSYTVYAIELPEGQGSLREEHRKAFQERVGKFADDVCATLREQTAALFGKLAKRIAAGEVVREDTFTKIREFVQRFELLNFLDDQEILRRLRQIQELVDGIAGAEIASKEQPELRAAIAGAMEEVAAVAEDMTDIDKVTGTYRRRILVGD